MSVAAAFADTALVGLRNRLDHADSLVQTTQYRTSPDNALGESRAPQYRSVLADLLLTPPRSLCGTLPQSVRTRGLSPAGSPAFRPLAAHATTLLARH